MVVFWQGIFYLAKWLYSVNVVVIGQCGCIRASDCIRAKWLYSGKVVVFRQSGCILANMIVFGQNGCIRAK